jgi:hypothetical protein
MEHGAPRSTKSGGAQFRLAASWIRESLIAACSRGSAGLRKLEVMSGGDPLSDLAQGPGKSLGGCRA